MYCFYACLFKLWRNSQIKIRRINPNKNINFLFYKALYQFITYGK